MPVDQYPFSYDEWVTLTRLGGARQHSFPVMGAEGSDYVTPLPRTGGGDSDEPEEWVSQDLFDFTLDPSFVALEDALTTPLDTPIEITILDHFPSKSEMIARLTTYANRPNAHPIFQQLIDGLSGVASNHFQITVEDSQPLLTHLLKTPDHEPDSFEGTLQKYNKDEKVRKEIGHGLFIASIIVQLLAQQGSLSNVKIHLVSVLNDKQLGLISDIAGVVYDIKAIHRSDPDTQRLINCSIQVFTPFDPPLDAKSNNAVRFLQGIFDFLRSATTDLSASNIMGTVTDLVRGRLSLVEVAAEILMGISNIFEVGEMLQLTTFLEKMPNLEIIAAAGNIPASVKVNSPPLPTYPAHIHTVLGVGSLANGAPDQPPALARFSRRSQIRKASTDGITTLGDVIGPYIGDVTSVPSRKANGDLIHDAAGNLLLPTADEVNNKYSGFVKWSGTSFSTAIITGLMARLCRRGRSAEDAFRALRRIAEQNDATTNTDVLPLFVTQE